MLTRCFWPQLQLLRAQEETEMDGEFSLNQLGERGQRSGRPSRMLGGASDGRFLATFRGVRRFDVLLTKLLEVRCIGKAPAPNGCARVLPIPSP